MRRKLMWIMLIIGCLLLPGSCQFADREMHTVSGRRMMVLPAEEVLTGRVQP